ncbi:PREDICTED: uncharacterized protein LOC108759685 [Trachymyrmex cornetzi]|uniref:uncharacterized protein LOC108759685 n=1 Tax=Trachymyrmex cornetzi TaxID=471704 RepID=UPI00084F7FF2|nr:PREDICTED: uncharacterized protein LOC108759685 [Trachymyrmex cornetzi]
MKSYVRSESSAEDGRPVKSSFRFYNRMQFLETVIQNRPTVSSLPIDLLDNSNSSNVSVHDIETITRLQSPKSNDSNVRPDNEGIEQIETDFMSYLKESQPIQDPVHNFCDMLGDILRRLQYNKRRDLQMEFLTRAIEVEKSTEFEIQ